jgi:hypothetical protein
MCGKTTMSLKGSTGKFMGIAPFTQLKILAMAWILRSNQSEKSLGTLHDKFQRDL